MRGNVEGAQETRDLEVSRQLAKTNALQQLAQSTNTEQGRRNLLGDTFKKQGAYGRGVSGLDQLIVSGDDQARRNLIQGTQAQAQNLQDSVGAAQTQYADEKTAQDMVFGNMGSDIANRGSIAEKEAFGDVSTAYDKALVDRKALLNPESEEYQNALASTGSELERLQGMAGSRSKYADYLQSFLPQISKDGQSADFEDYFDEMRSFDQTGQVQLPSTEKTDSWGKTTTTPGEILTGREASDYLNQGGGAYVSHHKHRKAISRLMDMANQGLLGGEESQDLYGLKGADSKLTGDNKTMRNVLGRGYNTFNRQIENFGTADEMLQKRLGQESGNNYSKLASGEDIGQYDAASDDQINKVNALRNLMGTQEITDEQRGDKEFTSAESLRDLLSRFK